MRSGVLVIMAFLIYLMSVLIFDWLIVLFFTAYRHFARYVKPNGSIFWRLNITLTKFPKCQSYDLTQLSRWGRDGFISFLKLFERASEYKEVDIIRTRLYDLSFRVDIHYTTRTSACPESNQPFWISHMPNYLAEIWVKHRLTPEYQIPRVEN